MRVYAVLLGIVLTAGSAYLAQLAVASAGFERLETPSPGRGDLAGPGELWYGGVIDPITVEAMRVANSAIVLTPPRTRTVACVRLAQPHPRRHARATECAQTSMDSMM